MQNLTTKFVLLLCFLMVTIVMASPTSASISRRRYNLANRLEKQGVDATTIGCKCIMSAPTKDKTDSTMCMCFNRKDGTMNESSKCTTLTGIVSSFFSTHNCNLAPNNFNALIDAVFTFCTDVTNTTKLWQTCVKHYCPCDADVGSPTPQDKVNF